MWSSSLNCKTQMRGDSTWKPPGLEHKGGRETGDSPLVTPVFQAGRDGTEGCWSVAMGETGDSHLVTPAFPRTPSVNAAVG